MSCSSNSSNNGGTEFDRNLKRFNNTEYTSRKESRERSRHFSDNSGISTHEQIVKTETKRGSILSRRIGSATLKVCKLIDVCRTGVKWPKMAETLRYVGGKSVCQGV